MSNPTYHHIRTGVVMNRVNEIPCRNWVVALAVAVVSALPCIASAQLQAPNFDLIVNSVCTSVACVAPSAQPRVRRGTTETLKLRGPFVDHVNSVTAAGMTNVSFYKSTCGSEGCMDLRFTVPSGKDVGSLWKVTLNTLTDNFAFNVRVARRGEITAVAQSPAEGVWGEDVRVKLTGLDIGNTRVLVPGSEVSSLDGAASTYGTDSVTFVVRGTGTAQTSSGFTAGDNSTTGLLGNYRFTTPTRTIKYSAVAGQPACATTPGIGIPSLGSPPAGQILTFASETSPVNATITLAWGPGYQGQFKPSEQFIVEIGQAMADAGSRTTAGTLTTGTTTIFRTATYTTEQGVMSKTLLLPRRVQYQWRVKAYNCGINGAYSAYSKFTVR